MLVVGFIGLPSAGKSTMINALAGKRVLESGVCRTTTDVCVFGARNEVGAAKWVPTELKSDDGVEFCAVDLPGICDAEDTESAFDALTLEWAAKCDVIAWVTDARTAFSTKHESAAVARIRESIQAKADDDGSLYQFLVVLATVSRVLARRDPELDGILEHRRAPRERRQRVSARRQVQRVRAHRHTPKLRGTTEPRMQCRWIRPLRPRWLS
jgi:hypothetical protein